MGAYQTTAVAVYEGYALTKSTRQFNFGGESLNELIHSEIKAQFNNKVLHPNYQI
jgi:actin-related protein